MVEGPVDPLSQDGVHRLNQYVSSQVSRSEAQHCNHTAEVCPEFPERWRYCCCWQTGPLLARAPMPWVSQSGMAPRDSREPTYY